MTKIHSMLAGCMYMPQILCKQSLTKIFINKLQMEVNMHAMMHEMGTFSSEFGELHEVKNDKV